jgi:predicted MFS family arabinose efflux permease
MLPCCQLPVGGWILSPVGLERGTVGAFFAVAALVAALPLGIHPVPILVAIGLLVGLGAGPAFSMATRDLAPEERALAMAILFTIFNIAMAVGPALAGLARDRSGRAETPFVVAFLYMFLSALAQLALVLRPRKEAQA